MILSRRSLLQLVSLKLAAQGMATRSVKPTPRGKPSGVPFLAKFTDVAKTADVHEDVETQAVACAKGSQKFVVTPAVFGPEPDQLRNAARVERSNMVAFNRNETEIRIEAPLENPSSARVLLIGGQPLNEPIARYGPFVMNTSEEIRQAFEDYRSGRMGSINF